MGFLGEVGVAGCPRERSGFLRTLEGENMIMHAPCIHMYIYRWIYEYMHTFFHIHTTPPHLTHTLNMS